MATFSDRIEVVALSPEKPTQVAAVRNRTQASVHRPILFEVGGGEELRLIGMRSPVS